MFLWSRILATASKFVSRHFYAIFVIQIKSTITQNNILYNNLDSKHGGNKILMRPSNMIRSLDAILYRCPLFRIIL